VGARIVVVHFECSEAEKAAASERRSINAGGMAVVPRVRSVNYRYGGLG
jgi:hypothetical protein